MKNIFRYSILLALCSFVGLVSCTREELSTEQFSDDAVVFGAFAPNPVVRGAELRITGSNLDRIVEVHIPGSEPITEIEVISSGKMSEIRVVTPAAGAEDMSVTGPVVIVDESGKTYKSKADITFTEGIVLDSFSPASALPGDEVTVKGDYLYNVQQIVLNNGVYVTGEQITAKSRRELKFIVPANAVTGPVTIGDVDENNNPDGLIPNNVPSKEELVIGDPTVEVAKECVLKAGNVVIVRGKHLDMIKSVSFGGLNVDFEVKYSGFLLEAALPAEAVEGDIVLVSYAGKEFKVGSYTTVIPTNVEIAPESRYKAGLNAVVTGNDLDLVTGASLAGTALEYAYVDDKLIFAIPAAAVDGTVVLSLANGKTVETEAIELVKPVITEMTPLELYAGDENITVKGDDLDLVTGVTLGGKDAEFNYVDGVIEVVTDATSVSGKIVCSLANGVTVESADEIKMNYHALVIVNSMPTAEHIGAKVTLTGANFMLVENIFIGDAKVQSYFTRTDEEVSFVMPYNKVGSYNIYFDLFNGDREMVATPIEVLLEINYITGWEGNTTITWNDGGRVYVPAAKFEGVKAGAKIRFYYTQKDQVWAQAQINYGDWSGLIFPELSGNTLVPTDIYGWFSDGILDRCTEFTLTQEILDNIQAKKGDSENQKNVGIIIQGSDLIFTKIEILQEISQEVTLWEGSADPQNYAVNLELGGDDNSSWRDANVQVGQIVKIYFDLVDPASWSIQMWAGHWGDMLAPQWNQDNSDGSLGYVSFEVTDALYENLTSSQNWGKSFILQGAGLIFTKITIL